jgi:hypothetical protein
MTTGIRCANCGSNRTNWLADAVGCEMCGAATRVDGELAHGPTVDPAAAAVPLNEPTEAAAHMTTTETVAEKADLDDLTVAELREQAAEQDIEGRSGMNKAELVEALGG